MENAANQLEILESARQKEGFAINDTWLVMSGDWGGQIYLTVPLKFVGPKAKILELLKEMDEFAWSCNEGRGGDVGIYSPSDPRAIAKGIICNRRDGFMGGMGGGYLVFGLWIHREFRRCTSCGDECEKRTDWVFRATELLDLKCGSGV